MQAPEALVIGTIQINLGRRAQVDRHIGRVATLHHDSARTILRLHGARKVDVFIASTLTFPGFNSMLSATMLPSLA